MRDSERGFTLVELLVGAAIAAFVIALAVVSVSRLANWTHALDTRVQSESAAERLTERLTTEADSAWAVYVPGSDVNGSNNGDGHELDFFAEDGAHRPYTWAYTYDATRKTITRYTIVPGTTPAAGEEIGPLDSFSATTVNAAQLAAADPLFAGATVTPVAYAFPASANAIGGNALVDVHITGSGVDRTTLLASATAPTTFTVIVPYTPSPPPVATPTPTPLTMTTPG